MPYKDPKKANENARLHYNIKKHDPVWMEKRRVRNRKNLKEQWKRISKDPKRKKIRMDKVRAYQKKWIHRPDVKEKRRIYSWNLKMQCLIAYGGSPPKCACCGEKEPQFLSLDHKKGDGAKHRKEIGGSTALYCWLIRKKFPKKVMLQVLCYNCNCAKGFFGTCPHKNEGARGEFFRSG